MGGYNIHVQRLNGPAGATALPVGATLGGSLAQAGESDAFTVSGASGEILLLRLAEVTTVLEPQLRVFTPAGVRLQGGWDYDVAELITEPLTTTGTYTVIVTDNPGTDLGDYSLHLQRLNGPVGGAAISYGQTQAGAVEYRAQTRSHLLTASAGDVILVRVAELATSLVPGLRIYDASGALLESVSDGVVIDLAEVTLPSAGVYTLLVLDVPGTHVGGYNIHVQRLNGPAGATALPVGATLGGSLAQAGESDAFTVSGASGEILLLRLAEVTTVLEPQLRVFTPAGVRLQGGWDYDVAELITEPLTTTGTYTVIVTDNPGTDLGDYSLHLQRLNGPVGGAAISYGQTQAGAVEYRAQTRSHLLTASAGDVILVRVAELATSLVPGLRIYDASGALLESVSNGVVIDLAEVTLPSAGVYTLLVLDVPGTHVGGYNIHVQRLNGPAGATALPVGATLGGSLAQAGESDAFTVSGASGEILLLRLAEVTTVLEPQLRVFTPAGVRLQGGWDYDVAELITEPLTTTGTYTVIVTDNPGTDLGDYSLHLQRLNGPVGGAAISYGQTQAGAVEYRAQTRSHLLTASAGDVILVRVAELATSLVPGLRIYDASGALLESVSDGVVIDLAEVTLPSAGVYTLLVLDVPGTHVGGYNIHVQRLNGPAGATALPVGVTIVDTLHVNGEACAFTFAGAVGDTIHGVLTELTAILEPQLRLFSPAGVLLASGWDYDEVLLDFGPLLAAGTHLLLVTDNPGTDTGRFQLRVFTAGGLTPVPTVPVKEFALHPARPNPFNPCTNLHFDLPAPAAVRLAILDLSGRVVTVLEAGSLPAGRHSLSWDGRDTQGRRVASGAYLCRLEAGGRMATRRVLLAK